MTKYTMLGSQKRSRAAAWGIIASVFLLVVYDFQFNDNEQYLPPTAGHRQLSAENPLNNASPHFWKYAWVIVTYHKAGHHLSHTLRNHIQTHINSLGGGSLRENSSIRPREDFNTETKCSELSLSPGTVTVIEAPEFHCNHKQLSDMLMNNPDPTKQKWGVKVIHLVRNPFTMAVSNYQYHSQDPTPEPFVHTTNPCHTLTEKRRIGSDEDDTVADLATPLLAHPHRKGLPIMTREDFDSIANDCTSLYQTKPKLTNATYYEHLRTLESTEGIRLSTTDKFNHISLMASDLLLFSRIQRMLVEDNTKRPWKQDQPWNQDQFHLITMPMDEWNEQPQEAMKKFLDFVFNDHLTDHKKFKLASNYADTFERQMEHTNHTSTEKNADTAELIEYLRQDSVFGGPLGRVEDLLEETLQEEKFHRLREEAGLPSHIMRRYRNLYA